MAKVKSKKSQKQSSAISSKAQFERVDTGITGLDDLISGGFLKGGTYLLLGTPGTGKTILANQICFHQIQKGKKAIYVTLLAESHTRMFGNLKPMEFFKPEQVADGIQYISGYSVLEKEGLDGLIRLLRDLVFQYGAKIIFIDGIASADELSGSTVAFKKFVHNLNSVIGMVGCTTFLLSSAEGDQTQPEYTMVDGILKLTFCHEGMKTAREIEVRKFRGSNHLYGKHFLEITSEGLKVYPRIEAAYGKEHAPLADFSVRKSFGLSELDKYLNGGLIGASTTALLGPAGTGKTQLGLQFLYEGIRKKEPVLFFSMYEHPDRIEAKFKTMGKSFSSALKNGLMTILRREPGDNLIDRQLHLLIAQVREKKIKRVFVDGINGFRLNMLNPGRLGEILTALFHELRSLGVTTIITEETDVFATNPGMSISNHSAVIDNIFEFRHVDYDGRRIQTFNIIKVRDSLFENSVYELCFTKSGLKLGNALEYTKPYLPTVRKSNTGSRKKV